VTAPSDAERASLAYLASTPPFARISGFFHAAWRFAHSASSNSAETTFFSASMVTQSPSRSSEIGSSEARRQFFCHTRPAGGT
jgi:hypothetical protein